MAQLDGCDGAESSYPCAKSGIHKKQLSKLVAECRLLRHFAYAWHFVHAVSSLYESLCRLGGLSGSSRTNRFHGSSDVDFSILAHC
jgi:hypothetical protein